MSLFCNFAERVPDNRLKIGSYMKIKWTLKFRIFSSLKSFEAILKKLCVDICGLKISNHKVSKAESCFKLSRS